MLSIVQQYKNYFFVQTQRFLPSRTRSEYLSPSMIRFMRRHGSLEACYSILILYMATHRLTPHP
jgi:hypothetical protein